MVGQMRATTYITTFAFEIYMGLQSFIHIHLRTFIDSQTMMRESHHNNCYQN